MITVPAKAIPEPSRGDLFFDFEGDPLYTEGDGTRFQLDRGGEERLVGRVVLKHEGKLLADEL